MDQDKKRSPGRPKKDPLAPKTPRKPRQKKLDENGNPIPRPPRKHTEETKRKIGEKRRLRSATNPPRHAGQSRKRKSLYDEIKHDYSKLFKKDERAREWLEKNKLELGHLEGEIWRDNILAVSREMGIMTEYSEMYPRVYEQKVGQITFDQDDVDDHARSVNTTDPYNMIDRLDDGLDIFGNQVGDEW